MPFTIQDFRSAFRTGGARPTLFEVQLPFPIVAGGASVNRQFSLMCRSAQIPESSLGVTNVAYYGRDIKVAGDRKFGDWTVTIYNDEDFNIRDAFERWSNSINMHNANLRDTAAQFLNGYQVDLEVIQFAKTGSELKRWKLIGAFPANIGPIQLDWEGNDQIETFEVTFAYTLWESDTTT